MALNLRVILMSHDHGEPKFHKSVKYEQPDLEIWMLDNNPHNNLASDNCRKNHDSDSQGLVHIWSLTCPLQSTVIVCLYYWMTGQSFHNNVTLSTVAIATVILLRLETIQSPINPFMPTATKSSLIIFGEIFRAKASCRNICSRDVHQIITNNSSSNIL